MRSLNLAGCQAALATGVNAVTDITGFGLAGHANEMAQASGVTIEIEIDKLPLLAGAAELAQQGNKTRASGTNRSFVQPVMRVDGTPDPLKMEFAFDAQTSGGLLISVPEERVDELVSRAREAGATTACIVGSVRAKQNESILLV